VVAETRAIGPEIPALRPRPYEINESVCTWTVRALSALSARLRINIKLHDEDTRLNDGQIYLFNHFARFETFIPQYLIYRQTGVYCRSVAAAEFFVEDNPFSNYLIDIGAVPNNLPGLLPFLATEILKGRKVVAFPEGGLVKDRNVVNARGEYQSFSSSANLRRQHHSGMAVLALMLDAFKVGIQDIQQAGEAARLEQWTERLGLDSVEELVAATRLPTRIIPSNITFYPIRSDHNLLQQGVEFFNKGIPKRLSEELLIEGNLLLRDTDMDIRLGTPIAPQAGWGRWHRRRIGKLIRRIESLDQLFDPAAEHTALGDRFTARWLRRQVPRVRDAYAREMYAWVTVNISHLAARLVMRLLERDQTEIEQDRLHLILYLMIKRLQKDPSIKMHRGLRNPGAYRKVLEGGSKDLERTLATAIDSELMVRENGRFKFLPKLRAEQDFHDIRVENPLAVAANEVAPISGVTSAADFAIAEAGRIDEKAMARLHFDDMLLDYQWERSKYDRPRYAEINAQETATESGEPFFIVPDKCKDLGVVLVHGFLASPAEVRSMGERIAAAGYPVIGPRLNGHGTSPWDLRERTWQNWQTPVRGAWNIISAFAKRVCLVGFSTGGALSLIVAAERPEKLAAVASVSTPLRFRNRNLVFVPLLHGANHITQWLPSYEGVMPFRANESEHPHINYRNMAIRGLFELRRAVDEMERRLPDVDCPVMLFQGDADSVVDPTSGSRILEKLGSERKWLHMIPARRHGILNENIGNVQEMVLEFLSAIAEQREPA